MDACDTGIGRGYRVFVVKCRLKTDRLNPLLLLPNI